MVQTIEQTVEVPRMQVVERPVREKVVQEVARGVRYVPIPMATSMGQRVTRLDP